MPTQITSELRKMLSTWSWWLIGAAMILATTGIVLILVMAGVYAENSPLNLAEAEGVTAVYSIGASMTYVFTVVVGILIVTSEYQSGTIGQTLLANPRRVQVFLAKIAAAAVSGALFGALTLVASVGSAMVVLSAQGLDPRLENATVLQSLAGTAATLTLWAIIGAGVGALARHQLGAIMSVVVLTQAAEPMLRIAFPGPVTDFLPGSLADAASGGTLVSLAMGSSDLGQGTAMVLMLALTAVVVFCGTLRFRSYQQT